MDGDLQEIDDEMQEIKELLTGYLRNAAGIGRATALYTCRAAGRLVWLVIHKNSSAARGVSRC